MPHQKVENVCAKTNHRGERGQREKRIGAGRPATAARLPASYDKKPANNGIHATEIHTKTRNSVEGERVANICREMRARVVTQWRNRCARRGTPEVAERERLRDGQPATLPDVRCSRRPSSAKGQRQYAVCSVNEGRSENGVKNGTVRRVHGRRATLLANRCP